MKEYQVTVGCTVDCYAKATIQAADLADLRTKLIDLMRDARDLQFEPEWVGADNYRMVGAINSDEEQFDPDECDEITEAWEAMA